MAIKNISFYISALLLTACTNKPVKDAPKKLVSFYAVRLVCHADTTVACGTRIKPLFNEMGSNKNIKAFEINHNGTVIAIWWDTTIQTKLMADTTITPIYKDNKIIAVYITDSARIKTLLATTTNTQTWYTPADMDALTKDEADAIAKKGIELAIQQGLVNTPHPDSLHAAIQNYYTTEFAHIKTYDELTNPDMRKQSDKDLYTLLARYTSKQNTMGVFKIFNDITFRKSYLADSSIDPCCIEPERP